MASPWGSDLHVEYMRYISMLRGEWTALTKALYTAMRGPRELTEAEARSLIQALNRLRVMRTTTELTYRQRVETNERHYLNPPCWTDPITGERHG